MRNNTVREPVRVASAARFCLVLITAPNPRVARRLATAALAARLIACANLVPQIESHYWWRGKIERSGEVLMICKTRRSLVGRLATLVRALHPYETPEVLIVPLTAGSVAYLAWLGEAATGDAG